MTKNNERYLSKEEGKIDNVPVSPSTTSNTKKLFIHRSRGSTDSKKAIIEVRRKLQMNIGFNFVPTELYDLE